VRGSAHCATPSASVKLSLSRVGEMTKEAWVGISPTYRCECGEKMLSLFISYGEPAVFEYPLVCPRCKRNLKSAVKAITKHPDIGEDVKIQLLVQLLDFLFL